MEEQIIKYACVCCGELTMDEQPPGTYQICPICGWEDDKSQFKDPDFSGGANAMSLNEARKKYQGGYNHEKDRKTREENETGISDDAVCDAGAGSDAADGLSSGSVEAGHGGGCTP